jgi:hypothetical protein
MSWKLLPNILFLQLIKGYISILYFAEILNIPNKR